MSPHQASGWRGWCCLTIHLPHDDDDDDDDGDDDDDDDDDENDDDDDEDDDDDDEDDEEDDDDDDDDDNDGWYLTWTVPPLSPVCVWEEKIKINFTQILKF